MARVSGAGSVPPGGRVMSRVILAVTIGRRRAQGLKAEPQALLCGLFCDAPFLRDHRQVSFPSPGDLGVYALSDLPF